MNLALDARVLTLRTRLPLPFAILLEVVGVGESGTVVIEIAEDGREQGVGGCGHFLFLSKIAAIIIASKTTQTTPM